MRTEQFVQRDASQRGGIRIIGRGEVPATAEQRDRSTSEGDHRISFARVATRREERPPVAGGSAGRQPGAKLQGGTTRRGFRAAGSAQVAQQLGHGEGWVVMVRLYTIKGPHPRLGELGELGGSW
jgi:hypothetical protein